ncbi:MAG: glycosyltransferase [Rhodobacteraceae bacterium]|jgi:glycosyltransferase involved in cell wall biosynthesis|nr:glycosyltransferase [Paracoccaceae bacterium]
MTARPLLVHVGPLPMMRNGIADYAAGILRLLTPHYQSVCVTHDPETVAPWIDQLAQVMSFDDYARHGHALRDARHLYHVGNNPDHVPVLDLLWTVPGTVVLHDLTLHYLLERWSEQTFGRIDAMTEVVRHLYGRDAAALSQARYARGRPVQSVFLELDCLPALAGCARSVITHSHLGHARLLAAGHRGPVAVIPHFAATPPAPVRERLRRQWRMRLGVGPGTVLFASLGFVTPAKQTAAVLRVLGRLPRSLPDWRFVIGGENRDPEVQDLCASLGLTDRVVFLDYLQEAEFDGILAAADLLVNLRFPTSGETSGTACRALAFGVPLLVSAHGWYAELPADAVFQIPPSARPESALHAALCLALAQPGLRAVKAAAARAYAERHLAPDQVTASYRTAIEAGHAAPVPPDADRVPPARLVTLPAAHRAGTRAAASFETVLADVIAAEHARIDGRPTQAVMLRGDFALAAPVAAPDAGPERQVFRAVAARGLVGGILAAVADAAATTRPGDLATLVVVSDTPEVASPRPPPRNARPGALPLTAQIQTALDDAGFAVLRLGETAAAPDGTFRRIVAATARRIGSAPRRSLATAAAMPVAARPHGHGDRDDR